MLQGLRKPVNDLSRGALVDDIVNTVAITAIQAQQVAAASSKAGAAMIVLVVNSGSSSLKYQLVDTESEVVLGHRARRADRRGRVAGDAPDPHPRGRDADLVESTSTATIADHGAAFRR